MIDIQEIMNKELTNLMDNDLISEMIRKTLSSRIEHIIDESFKWNGECHKAIKKKIDESMIPIIESSNFDVNTLKLDEVLTSVMKEITFDNNAILKNFSRLISLEKSENLKVITVEDIFEKWKKSLDTSFDNDEEYNLTVNANKVSSSWSSFETYVISFECEENGEYNKEFQIWRKKESSDDYYITIKDELEISSLKHMNDFDIFMIQIKQLHSKIKSDCELEFEETIRNNDDDY